MSAWFTLRDVIALDDQPGNPLITAQGEYVVDAGRASRRRPGEPMFWISNNERRYARLYGLGDPQEAAAYQSARRLSRTRSEGSQQPIDGDAVLFARGIEQVMQEIVERLPSFIFSMEGLRVMQACRGPDRPVAAFTIFAIG